MGKSKAAKVQVPECRYGAACTRRDCIFKHPPKKERQPQAPQQEKSDKVCFAYVAGRCAFGRQCHDRHPDDESCRTIRDRYSRVACQWGGGCRTEGCLYMHPSSEPVGPAMPQEPPKPQPAVFAAGPRIVPQQPFPDDTRAKAGPAAPIPIPKAIQQASDLRDASACAIKDPLERFQAVNAHNTGTQSAALLDLHFQSTQTFQVVLDEVLPERLRMFPNDKIWVVTGAGHTGKSGSLFDAVREYFVKRRCDFSVCTDVDGQQSAFCVRGRAKTQDALGGVRAVVVCGVPGSGKSALVEALVRKSGERFVRICQDELAGDQGACEDAFRRALKLCAGSWWWDTAFSSEKFSLSVCMRAPALSFLREFYGVPVPVSGFLHAYLAYNPSALDLRRHLGRPHRLLFRSHLVLEATLAPFNGETLEVILCSARALDSDPAAKPISLHIALRCPKGAEPHLQVLNAIPADKRILANAKLGSFQVRQVLDLSGSRERLGLALLVNKVGDGKGMPAQMSFDIACLTGPEQVDPRAGAWTNLADAAFTSLEEVLCIGGPEVHGTSNQEWTEAVAQRCAGHGLRAPHLQMSRCMTLTESKYSQWKRLHPNTLLHCCAEESALPQWTEKGAAVLRREGGVVLPPKANELLPRVVVLDRCNAERVERRHWLQVGGLQRNEVMALHLDVPEAECVNRVAKRGERHPLLKVASLTAAAAAVRRVAERFEPPTDREGFRAIVRLKGAAAAVQELVRRWTEGVDADAHAEPLDDHEDLRFQAPASAPEDLEAPAPPRPCLKQWIEVEEQGGRRSVWGVPLSCPVDAPLETLSPPTAPLEGLLALGGAGDFGAEEESAEESDMDIGATVAAKVRAAASAEASQPHQWDDQFTMPSMGAHEDAEEWARQEQLAATLRCMGFDEEPSMHAALRAGGNLNVAVESVLQSRGSST